MTEIGVLGTRQQLATVPVRSDIEEVVPVREAELTLQVEVGRSFGDLRVV